MNHNTEVVQDIENEQDGPAVDPIVDAEQPIVEPARTGVLAVLTAQAFIITPTIGRVVWYTPHDDDAPMQIDKGQKLSAQIAYVWSDRMVNLSVVDHNGIATNRTSVPLLQEGDVIPQGGNYAEWMPYQLGQAKKSA